VPIKSRQLCRIELRSREVWPAGLEPAPRRVSGDRSTVAELRPHGDGRGWTRTSSLLFVRQALSALELLAQGGFGGRPLVVSVRRRHSQLFAKPPKLRDKDSNLDLRVQSAVSWPLDDPGTKDLRMSRRANCCTAMLSMPLAYASALDRARSLLRCRGRRVLRGGVLEPGARACFDNCAGKSRRCTNSVDYRAEAREDLSLSDGASISY
jgi:hypothetical protein